jgi:hypothetical protein
MEAPASGDNGVKPEPGSAPVAPADAPAAAQSTEAAVTPSLSDLEAAVGEFLKGQDLATTTTKMVRAHLETKFASSMAPFKGAAAYGARSKVSTRLAWVPDRCRAQPRSRRW